MNNEIQFSGDVKFRLRALAFLMLTQATVAPQNVSEVILNTRNFCMEQQYTSVDFTTNIVLVQSAGQGFDRELSNLLSSANVVFREGIETLLHKCIEATNWNRSVTAWSANAPAAQMFMYVFSGSNRLSQMTMRPAIEGTKFTVRFGENGRVAGISSTNGAAIGFYSSGSVQSFSYHDSTNGVAGVYWSTNGQVRRKSVTPYRVRGTGL